MTARALIAVTEFGVEEPELVKPLAALRDAGVDVTVASDTGSDIQTVTGDKDWASVQHADAALGDIDPADYGVLILPGGTVNADTLRLDEHARSIVRSFAEAGKSVAAICHAPWALIDAGVVEGKTLTSYTSVRTDLENAGATWVDQQLKRCEAKGWTLITSRNPGDLEAFDEAVVAEALSA